MKEQGLRRADSPDIRIEPGDFIEFSADLHRNPMIDALDSMSALLEMVAIFTQAPETRPGEGSSQRAKDLGPLRNRLESFSKALKPSGTVDLTTGRFESGMRAVVTTETKYLNDPAMSDLVDGRFTIVGKVTRAVHNTDDSISLLRNTGLRRAGATMRETLITAFRQLRETKQMSLPEIEPDIPGPVIQVLPIAVA